MSVTPRSERFDDIYFAVEDGLEETRHVFLAGNGLPERWQGCPCFTIAETGFGTGLNFFSVWKAFEETARPGQRLNFISFEKYPLRAAEIATYLSRWEKEIGPQVRRLQELYPLRVTGWHTLRVSPRVTLLLIFDDVNRALPELEETIDAWFLDGHAPAKNPEMWSETVFSSMNRLSSRGATAATFTAAGQVKRGLAAAGFTVEKCRGFGRKRDMLRATRLEGGREPSADTAVPSIGRVAVIGGGIAGLGTASALSRAGKEVVVYEETGIASCGSGNPVGLYNPRFSAQKSADADFYGTAYALAVRSFGSCGEIDFSPCGNLHLVTGEDKRKRFSSLLEKWDWHPDHIRLLTSEEASEVAGVKIPVETLYLPDGGHVSPVRFCRKLAAATEVRTEKILAFNHDGTSWMIADEKYDAIVVANAAGCLSFRQTHDLPLQTIRGQIGVAPATSITEKLAANLCYGGYCTRSVGGSHVVGATFQPWLTDCTIREEDHQKNLQSLTEAVPEFSGQLTMQSGRAALRAASRDRSPLGGMLKNQPPHLYVSVAHGSHGLLSGILIGEHLAALMTGGMQMLPTAALNHIDPGRFARQIISK